MGDDVVRAKAEIIERCLKRVQEEYAGDPANLHQNWTKQDSIILNLERACQAAIDLALRIIKLKALGLPKDSREAFTILQQGGVLSAELSGNLQRMVGFRNIAIHTYRDLDMSIVETILRERLEDFRKFVKVALQME